ncbi:dephospho-CoA kinase [Gracilibacillus dipsosauri]|uniref:Dephospho-CoA kinase n=1 Tax=Gracilibacillus dipsosauri TaxID=178340 RepID=A0A317KXQ1_9BACI|nr:dephospho-CoA kinase [Gracilibacillus dipsosauri]PWU68185.1 dephospho-CoA kinase [Gracilibacillus dipsosauri]
MIIGLTGNIASGKSTVSNMLKESYQIPIIDADIIARQVVEPGETSYDQIVETFGRDILLDDQTINRKKLGQLIFHDSSLREKLNNIVHPAVRRRMEEEKQAHLSRGEKVIVLDIPLLFENNLTHLVDRTIVVFTEEKQQLKRLMNRNHLTEAEAKERMNAQMDPVKKKRLADAVIDNSGSLEQTEQQLEKLMQKWRIFN